jgi:hypothetical protein
MKDTGVGLMGRLPGDEESPDRMIDNEPCSECREHMEMGFLLIERTETHITGRRWVIRREVISSPEMREKGVAYITPDGAKDMGLYNDVDIDD